MANGLRALGLEPGDRVALCVPMVPEILSILYGCFKAGLTVVPIFAGFGAGAIATRLEDSGARVLFTADHLERRGKLIPLASKMPPFAGHTIVLRTSSWHDVPGSAAAEAPTSPLDSEARAFILYTSGTTGKPKGTVHTHAGCLAQMGKEIWLGFDHRDDDRFFWLSDIGWMMGPWTILGNHLFGGTIFLYDGAPDFPGPMRLWEMIERHRITTFGVSPTAIRVLSKSRRRAAADGLAAPARLHRRALGRQRRGCGSSSAWAARRCPIINISGGTEIVGQLPVSAADPAAQALHAGRARARHGHRGGGRERRPGARPQGIPGLHRSPRPP